MNKLQSIQDVRSRLQSGRASVGSWMQIPDSNVAEILGAAGFDWVAIDIEHGQFSVCQLPDLFRSLELGDTLPLARLREGSEAECKAVMDAGAAGVIVPMVSSREQLEGVRDSCRWPPNGHRGVAFSRANLFGKNFEQYSEIATKPLLIAMIESVAGVEALDDILETEGLDAIFIGPYDLSASLGVMGRFSDPRFETAMNKVVEAAKRTSVPAGLHVVEPNQSELEHRILEGYQFIAFSIDSVMISSVANSAVIKDVL